MSAFQSMVILAERGFNAEVQVSIRVLLEIMFRLGALIKDPRLDKYFRLQSEYHRKERLTALRDGKIKLDLRATPEDIRTEIGEIDAILSKNKFDPKMWTVRKLAKKAELESEYRSF
jgi:hypothetical protein